MFFINFFNTKSLQNGCLNKVDLIKTMQKVDSFDINSLQNKVIEFYIVN